MITIPRNPRTLISRKMNDRGIFFGFKKFFLGDGLIGRAVLCQGLVCEISVVWKEIINRTYRGDLAFKRTVYRILIAGEEISTFFFIKFKEAVQCSAAPPFFKIDQKDSLIIIDIILSQSDLIFYILINGWLRDRFYHAVLKSTVPQKI